MSTKRIMVKEEDVDLGSIQAKAEQSPVVANLTEILSSLCDPGETWMCRALPNFSWRSARWN